MNWIEAIILGALQGVTEFLPISSSGHLILGEQLLGLEVADLKAFDVVVHLGTLLSILIYFWKDIWKMLCALGRLLSGRLKRDDKYFRLIIFILIGTVPAVFMGLYGEDYIDGAFRNVQAVALWMITIGMIFVLGEKMYKHDKKGLTWGKSLIIGLAQAVALIPGVSRSGSTIVAGLFNGIDRSEAARFSFLLGIPAIAGAGILTGLKVAESGGPAVATSSLLLGFLSAFVFGLLSVWWLMRFLKKHSLNIFAGYLIVIGVIVLLTNF